MNSIVSVGDGLVLLGHRIIYFRNRMGDFAYYLEMGFAGRGPSIEQCYQSSDGRKLLPRLSVLGLGR